MEMKNEELLAKANEFFEAYNSIDLQALDELVANDIRWEHHNRFKGEGKEKLMDSVKDFGEKAPGRYFSKPSRWAVNGDIAFVEHKWHAVPAVDVPSFGWTKGVHVTLDCCALLAFKDGKIIEFSDYA